MNQFFNQLQKEALKERLSRDEKQRMRINLHDSMERSPLAPTVVEKGATRHRVKSPYSFFSFPIMAPVCAVLVVVLGSGTAFAAQGSLPGDALYAVKINFNEQISQVLATTPAAKAEVHASLAQARLEEAETLASTGKLTASTSAILTANFDEHVDASESFTGTIAEHDPAVAAELSAKFDSSIAAHGAILAELGDDSDNNQSKEDSNTLAMHVRERSRDSLAFNDASSQRATMSSKMQVQTFSATAPAPEITTLTLATSVATNSGATITNSSSSNTSNKKSAPTRTNKEKASSLRLQSQASSTLEDAGSDFDAIRKSLDVATIAQIEAQFSMIMSVMQEGSAHLSAGEYSSANESFTSVIRMGTRLDTYLVAGKKFNKRLLSSLLSSLGGRVQSDTSNESNSKGEGNNTSEGNHSNTTSSSGATTTEVRGSGEVESETEHSTSSSSSGKNKGNEDSFLHSILNF